MNKIHKVLLTCVLFLLAGCGSSSPPDSWSSVEHLWAGANSADIFDEPHSTIDTMLDQMAAADLRVLRIIIDFRLEMESNGTALSAGLYDDCILDEIDYVMNRAGERGILLIIVLEDYRWIMSTPYVVSAHSHGWRNCKTPETIYNNAISNNEEYTVYGPSSERRASLENASYLTDETLKFIYKGRVSHILNHVNSDRGLAWKDINDVILAWEPMNEPENLFQPADEIRSWLDEMATYIKGIDPDTHVATGTANNPTYLGNLADADIYTYHAYTTASNLAEVIAEFRETIGRPYHKLLLVEEFNPGAQDSHTPGDADKEKTFEDIMATCEEYQVPWMFWEYDYNVDPFDSDDVWHTSGEYNNNSYSDGVFWGAKALQDAMKMWRSIWSYSSVDKNWGVQEKVDALCARSDSNCNLGGSFYLLDTFGRSSLGAEFEQFDEGTADSFGIRNNYLRIEASAFQDLWEGTRGKTGAPILFYTAPGGNYIAKTFVSADPIPTPSDTQPNNSQMGVFIYQDADNWIFFGLTQHEYAIDGVNTKGDGLIATVTEGGSSSIVTYLDFPPDYVFLKIKRTGSTWELYWKINNASDWTLFTAVDLPLGTHKVGIGVKTLDVDGPIESAHANFDFLSIEEW